MIMPSSILKQRTLLTAYREAGFLTSRPEGNTTGLLLPTWHCLPFAKALSVLPSSKHEGYLLIKQTQQASKKNDPHRRSVRVVSHYFLKKSLASVSDGKLQNFERHFQRLAQGRHRQELSV